MDERELRTAMDHAVAVAPPPMREESVLTAGRLALKRRRALRASTWSAAMVAIVAVGVTVLVPSQGHDGDAPVAGQLTPAPDTATATAGSPQDRSAALAAALDALAPAGYGTPGDLKGVDDYAGRTLKNHKGMQAGVVNGTEVWRYAAGTPLTKGDGVGELVAAVYTPGWATGEGCGLTSAAWDTTRAQCTEVVVDGKKVAVADVTHPPEDGLSPEQWAGYRHADGTVVFVMQTAKVARSGRPALAAMPMTGQQLAALAVNPRLEIR
jgi:hypothetical protein